MKTFTRLLGYLRYEWKLLLSGFILLIFSTGLSIYTPIIASKMIDYVSLSVANEETVNITFITEQFGFYLIITFISAILGYVGYLLLANGSNRLSKVIRDEAHEHMQKLPVSYFDDIPAGKISARIVNDTEVLRENYFANFTTQILINTMTILGVYIGMFAVSPTIASWLLLLIPIIVVWQMAFSKKIQPINTLWRESVSELNSKIAEIVQGVSIVQVFNQQEHMAEEFEQVNQTWLNTRKESLKYEAFFAWNLSGLFKSIVTLLVMLYIGTQFTSGILSISIGTLYIVINYVERLFDPITMIVRLITILQQALSAGMRVFELMDTPVEKDSDKSLIVTQGNVEFNDVTFAYKEGNNVLHQLNFNVNAGETIGLVGHTGSGKSSIINLLFRFYDPQAGQVIIDGQNIEEYNRESIREKMGIVLQEPYLFSGTIATNISMNNPEITDDMVLEALIKVGAQPLINKLEKGIHAEVVEKGQAFSSGERQLISFARTLANNPKILILDEATSHIDTETEEVIQHAMKVVKEGRTTFIVAHRLSTIKDADQIIVMDNGHIQERGTHRELLDLGGTYTQMYQMQGSMA